MKIIFNKFFITDKILFIILLISIISLIFITFLLVKKELKKNAK